MKRFNYLLSIFALAFLLTFTSCSDDDDDDDKDTAMEYVLTESMFNTATNAIQTNINTGAMAHNGTEQTGEDTFRDVFTNMSDVNGQASPGDIITKYVYGKDENGNKNANSAVVFAMVKQESAFGDDSGNWYWYMLPTPDGSIDFSSISRVTENTMCFSCHAGAGAGAENDYRFVFAN